MLDHVFQAYINADCCNKHYAAVCKVLCSTNKHATGPNVKLAKYFEFINNFYLNIDVCSFLLSMHVMQLGEHENGYYTLKSRIKWYSSYFF